MRPILLVASLSMFSFPAAATESACSGASSGMGCFDAAPLSGPAEPSPFRWFGRGRVLEFGRFASTSVLRYATSPAELVAPGSDPSGRLIPVVLRTMRLDLRFAVGLGRNLDLTLTLPMAISQAGSGPDALLTQSPPPLASSGFGDTRASLRTALPERLESFDWALRLEFTFPVGSERAYLGNRAMTEAFAVNAHWSDQGLSLVSDLGVRVSRPARFGDVTLGTHAFFGLGFDYGPLPDDLVHFSLECLVRPSLVPAPQLPTTVRSGAQEIRLQNGHADWVMPAEWLASISSRPFSPDLWFSVGAGTALPLSHRDRSDSRVDAWFVAPSTPRTQVIGSIALRN
jgi:hypothetical protein